MKYYYKRVIIEFEGLDVRVYRNERQNAIYRVENEDVLKQETFDSASILVW